MCRVFKWDKTQHLILFSMNIRALMLLTKLSTQKKCNVLQCVNLEL